MRIRAVPCIHVAAYLFSGLILGVSLFSFYRAIQLTWKVNTTGNSISIHNGFCLFSRGYKTWRPLPFKASLKEPTNVSSLLEDLHPDFQIGGRNLLFSSYFVPGPDYTKIVLYVVPLWVFLVIPMIWMCGFYLFKLRQRIRSSRDELNMGE